MTTQKRGFSSTPSQKDNIKYSEEYLQKQQEQKTEKKGKFFEFIKKIDTLDAKPAEGAKVKSDYDISELDISFDKISKQAPSTAGATTTGKAEEVPAAV